MCQYSADDGVASDWHLNHLGMLANSGAALARDRGHRHRASRPHQPWLLWALFRRLRSGAGARRRPLPPLRYREARHSTRPCRTQGLRATAMGRRWRAASRDEDRGRRSLRRRFRSVPAGRRPREMTTEDMERVRDGFVQAAKRAVRAGIDAIELHGAHGYLLHSFRLADLQPAQRRIWRLARRRACAFRSKSRKPCARWCPQGHAARGAHHRQRLDRRRADRRRCRRVCARRSRPSVSISSASPPAASAPTRGPLWSPI